MTESIIQLLGLDEDDLSWQDLALCKNMRTELFYDEYESSDSVAKMVDQACLSCPVMKQCLQSGIDNNEWGTWGGVYLTNGKRDVNRNSHKTDEIWIQIGERISA